MSPIKESALNTFRAEAEAVQSLAGQLTDDFEKAVPRDTRHARQSDSDRHGQVGLGRPQDSRHAGQYRVPRRSSSIRGSLPRRPRHDRGGDIVLALSNSGQTDEVLRLIPYLQECGNTVIAMTGNAGSTLAKNSTYHLDVSVKSEACPLSLAPTCSTTAQLAMGDALAVALMNERGFRAEDFARFHPGGSLGRRLLTRVGDVMRSEHLRTASPSSRLGEVIITISDARMAWPSFWMKGR